MGQSILTQQKTWSLLPPQPRNAIPDSIASHSSLFPSLSFSLSLSLSLWPISGGSSSCRRWPKNRSCWRDSRYKTRVLTAGHFSSQHVALYTKNKILSLKLIFVLLIYYLKLHNSSTYITPQTILPRRNRRCALSATGTWKPDKEKDARGVWGLKGFYEGQWLRARLCCRKISDSIFWLFCFTPRWLAGAMPCPKKVHKKYTKKIETDKRRKHFFHTFLYLPGEWTNQHYVPRHSVVPKTPDSKNGVIGSTSLPEKREVHRKPEYLCLFTGSKFATRKSF